MRRGLGALGGTLKPCPRSKPGGVLGAVRWAQLMRGRSVTTDNRDRPSSVPSRPRYSGSGSTFRPQDQLRGKAAALLGVATAGQASKEIAAANALLPTIEQAFVVLGAGSGVDTGV